MLVLVLTVLVCFTVLILHAVLNPIEKEKEIVYVLPEKTDIPCVIYKVDDAFVIIINDKELSK
jgi:hypothetical protein